MSSPVVQHPSDEFSSYTPSENFNQVSAVSNHIKETTKTILALYIDEFKSKVDEMFSTSSGYENFKSIREAMVAEINAGSVTQEKSKIFITKMVSSVKHCEIEFSEQCLSSMKNILRFKESEFLKQKIEENKLVFEIKLQTLEDCDTFKKFSKKFNVRFKKLDVEVPEYATQSFIRYINRIQDAIKDEEIRQLVALVEKLQERISKFENTILQLLYSNEKSQEKISSFEKNQVRVEIMISDLTIQNKKLVKQTEQNNTFVNAIGEHLSQYEQQGTSISTKSMEELNKTEQLSEEIKLHEHVMKRELKNINEGIHVHMNKIRQEIKAFQTVIGEQIKEFVNKTMNEGTYESLPSNMMNLNLKDASGVHQQTYYQISSTNHQYDIPDDHSMTRTKGKKIKVPKIKRKK